MIKEDQKDVADLYKMKADIMSKVDDAVIKDAQGFIDKVRVNSNWASKIGHPCTRYLCYFRTHWHEQVIRDVNTLKMFKVGQPLENIVEMQIRQAGFNIYQKRVSEHWKKYNIGMKVDRWLEIDKLTIPCEIKSMSPFAYDSINTIDDFLMHPRWYMRQYPSQILSYCWKNDSKYGFLIPFHKINGQWKIIPFYAFDSTCMEIMEKSLKKVERVNKYVKEFDRIKNPKTYEILLPKRKVDFDMCLGCEYKHLCNPILTMSKDATHIPAPDDFEETIARWLEIKPTSSEYNKLDKKIKGHLQQIELHENAVVGKFYITTSHRHRDADTKEIEEKEIYSYKIQSIKEEWDK